MKNIKRLAIVLVASLLVLAGCTADNGGGGTANADGPIVISILAADHGWLAELSYHS